MGSYTYTYKNAHLVIPLHALGYITIDPSYISLLLLIAAYTATVCCNYVYYSISLHTADYAHSGRLLQVQFL